MLCTKGGVSHQIVRIRVLGQRIWFYFTPSGMYMKRVKKDRIFFEIPALILSTRKSRAGKFKITIHILNFPAQFSSVFPHLQDKRTGISKIYLS